MTYLLLVSYPDGLVPAETFIDPTTFSNLDEAITEARVFIRDEKAIRVVLYSMSQNGTLDRVRSISA